MNREITEELLKDCGRERLLDMIFGFCTYNYNPGEYTEHLQNIPDRSTAVYIAETVSMACWLQAKRIIEEENKYGVVTREKVSESGWAFERMLRGCVELQLPWTFRKKILDQMLDLYPACGKLYRLNLFKAGRILCTGHDELHYLAYHLPEEERVFVQMIAKELLEYGDSAAYEDLMLKTIWSKYNYAELADFYKDSGQTERAVSLIRKGLDACKDKDILYRWLMKEYEEEGRIDLMKDLYLEALDNNECFYEVSAAMFRVSSEYPDRKKYLLGAIAESPDAKLYEWYQTAENSLTEEDFSEYHDLFMDMMSRKDKKNYAKECIREKNYSEALKLLYQKAEGIYEYYIDSDHGISAQLIPIYPKEIADLYFDEVRKECSGVHFTDGHSENQCRSAAEKLIGIRQILMSSGLEEHWKKKYRLFRRQFNKDRKMIRILDQMIPT